MPWTSSQLNYLSSDFVCPPVDIDGIYSYFEQDGDPAKIPVNAWRMYKEGFLVSLMQAREKEKLYVRCQVMAEMTKGMKYVSKAVIDKHGTVGNSNCDCTAGAGSKAKCKHVAVVLFALESLSRTGKLKLQKTCTDLPQKWHEPARGPMQSPRKASGITYGELNEAREQDAAPTPVAPEPGASEKIVNLLLNFQVSN